MLMDIQMPDMNGLEATRTIRQIAGAGPGQLPIVAMTANAMEGDRERSLAAGMDDHITKPIDPDELYATLLKWIAPASASTQPPSPARSSDVEVLDDAAALRRVAGNTALYHDMLGKFRRDFADSDTRLRAAFAQNDPETARLLAHTLKGVAGNLGAGRLQASVAALDHSLHDATSLPRTSPLLDSVERELARALASIDAVLPAPSSAPPPSAPAPVGDLSELQELLRRIEPHLLRRQPAPCKLIMQDIASRSWPPAVTTRLRELDDHLSRYRFKEAPTVVSLLLAA